MIEYIKGELTELTPALAVVEAHGVGYALSISLNTYSAIQGKTAVKLFVHEAIMTGGRDDSYTLYGFATKQERSLYQLLITVSGVGANTARMILSSLTPAELRTAQRIIVDLKDKIMQSGIADELHVSSQPGTPAVDAGIKDEAVSALTMLGFSPAPSAKVVVSILTEQPDLPVEQVVKMALKMIK